MRRSPWTGLGLSAVLSTVILSACSDQTPSGPANVPATPSPIVAPTYAAAKGPGGESRYVIQFKKAEGADFETRVKALGGKIERRHTPIATVLVTGLTPANAATLKGRADVQAVSTDLRAQWIPRRDQLIKGTKVAPARINASNPNDQSGAFFYDFQWNIRRINAPNAWKETPAGKGVTVCLLDTGIDPGQSDLKGKVNLRLSKSFVASEPFIQDHNFHGTYTAGIVASNGLGTASVAPAARLCELKVLDATGSGDFADVIAAIVYAGENRVQVINMSLGALLDFRDPDQLGLANVIQAAIDFAHQQGTAIVAASGNDNLNLDQSVRVKAIPAQLNHVISVGATGPINQQRFDRLASYSNYGRKGNDMVAPGGENINGITLDKFVLPDLIASVCSRFICGGDFFTVWADGTSAAAPHVAGALAVAESQLAGNQSPDALERCVLDHADNIGPAVFFGAGRLNVLAAAKCAPTS